MSVPPEIARMEGNLAFQRRVWRVERLGWVAMAAIVVAALLGLFGGGGRLAEAEARSGGLEAAWARIGRLRNTAPIRVTLPPEPGAREAELRLDPDFPERWRLRDATPPLLEAVAGRDAFVLRVRRDATGSASLALHVEPTGTPGPRRLHLSSGGQSLELPVFVWP